MSIPQNTAFLERGIRRMHDTNDKANRMRVVVNVSMKGGGHPSGFQYEPRRIDITVERDIGISMDETSDMKVRLASGVTAEDAE